MVAETPLASDRISDRRRPGNSLTYLLRLWQRMGFPTRFTPCCRTQPLVSTANKGEGSC
jgi:hypothetical protein